MSFGSVKMDTQFMKKMTQKSRSANKMEEK